MANLAYYAANRMADKFFGRTDFTPPATLYLGLSTTAVGVTGSGITEPTGGYSRVAITNNKTNFGNALNGQITNLVAFTFTESTASWGTIGHWFISDASTGGNVYFRGTLTPTRTVESLTVLTIPIGSLVITTT
jgi:hypothetical protein